MLKNSDKPTLDELHLKIGARVMVLINDTEQDLISKWFIWKSNIN